MISSKSPSNKNKIKSDCFTQEIINFKKQNDKSFELNLNVPKSKIKGKKENNSFYESLIENNEDSINSDNDDILSWKKSISSNKQILTGKS